MDDSAALSRPQPPSRGATSPWNLGKLFTIGLLAGVLAFGLAGCGSGGDGIGGFNNQDLAQKADTPRSEAATQLEKFLTSDLGLFGAVRRREDIAECFSNRYVQEVGEDETLDMLANRVSDSVDDSSAVFEAIYDRYPNAYIDSFEKCFDIASYAETLVGELTSDQRSCVENAFPENIMSQWASLERQYAGNPTDDYFDTWEDMLAPLDECL